MQPLILLYQHHILCTPTSSATTSSTYLSGKMSWAVTWSFFLIASVRGKTVFILERGIWHLAVTSAGVSNIFQICCWIGGRGSWGCKALCARHCGEGRRVLKRRCRRHVQLPYTFLVKDPPSSVWEGYRIPTPSKREQRGWPRNDLQGDLQDTSNVYNKLYTGARPSSAISWRPRKEAHLINRGCCLDRRSSLKHINSKNLESFNLPSVDCYPPCIIRGNGVW